MQMRFQRCFWLLSFAAALICASPISCPAQNAGAAAEKFAVSDYLVDLDELQRRLLDQSSYLERRDFDHEKAFATVRQSINEQTDLTRFVYDVQKLIMQIGDCHADVRFPKDAPASKSLPFRPADTGAGVAALNPSSNQPLDSECPYLESIDGVSLDRWLEAASQFVAQASPQLVRRRSLEWMGNANLMRSELNLPQEEIVQVGLRSAGGTKHSIKRLRVSGLPYYIATLRLRPTRVLNDNIGYLRIRSMDDRLVEAVVRELKSLKDTTGLIIDVRDNPGGTYGIMRGIYGFFVPDNAKPKITNVAAYRLSPSFARNHIEYRPTFRADWPGWNEQERQAIRDVAETFMPEWILPTSKFSEWHYMILSRTRSGRGGPSQQTVGGISDDYFYYDKPVVVLSNAGSFSAADGFVNAFGDLPQVTVMGEPSAGGSGATRTFRLPNTGVGIALASMASFRPNGKLFDGNGIEVDVTLRPTLEDFTTDGDSVLARAVEVINEKARPQQK
jgi:hypothetical protein